MSFHYIIRRRKKMENIEINLSNKPTEFLLDSQLLINSVREHPLLYDSTRKDFNNRKKKREVWMQIFEKVLPNVKELSTDEREFCENELQKKWRNMRDSYTKEYKRRANLTTQPTKPAKPYIYYDSMSFLLPITAKRHSKTESNFQNASSSVEMYLEVEDNESSHVSPSISINHNNGGNELRTYSAASKRSVSVSSSKRPRDSSPITTKVQSPKQRRLVKKQKSKSKTSNHIFEKPTLEKYLEQFLKHINHEMCTMTTSSTHNADTPKENPDPDEMFLLSMLPFWKKLDDNMKLKTQIDILRLIQARLNEQKS